MRNLVTKPIYGNDYGSYLQFNEAFFRAEPIFKIDFVPVEPSEPSVLKLRFVTVKRLNCEASDSFIKLNGNNMNFFILDETLIALVGHG